MSKPSDFTEVLTSGSSHLHHHGSQVMTHTSIHLKPVTIGRSYRTLTLMGTELRLGRHVEPHL